MKKEYIASRLFDITFPDPLSINKSEKEAKSDSKEKGGDAGPKPQTALGTLFESDSTVCRNIKNSPREKLNAAMVSAGTPFKAIAENVSDLGSLSRIAEQLCK